jgi:Bacterial PH domain
MREFRPVLQRSAVRVVFALVLPLVVLVPLAWLLASAVDRTPATYTIGEGALVVRSGDLLAGTRTVRLADVTEARVVTLQGARRTAGTALPGFCAGRFSYPDLGAVWQVTTCSARGVLVRAGGEDRPIVVSPPDPRAFLEALGTGTPTEITLPPADRRALRILAFILVPVVLVSVVAASAVLLLGPSRLRYLVGGGVFEVRTLLGRKRWPTAGARAKAYRPSRLLRVAGVGAPGYHTGLFREAGQSTRVYATEMETVLLFEGEARVMVSPEDRVAMLRALEEEGVTIERHAA